MKFITLLIHNPTFFKVRLNARRFSRLQTQNIQVWAALPHLQPLYKHIFTHHLVWFYWPVETFNLYKLICSALYHGKPKENYIMRILILGSSKILTGLLFAQFIKFLHWELCFVMSEFDSLKSECKYSKFILTWLTAGNDFLPPKIPETFCNSAISFAS